MRWVDLVGKPLFLKLSRFGTVVAFAVAPERRGIR